MGSYKALVERKSFDEQESSEEANNNSNNNNNNPPDTDGDGAKRRLVRSKPIDIDAPPRPSRQRRGSESNSSDGWQILEFDEQTPPADDEEAQRKTQLTPTTTTTSSNKRPATKYVDIDPLEGRHHSAALVKICVTLYALMLPLAFWTFMGLLFILFTRFWFVTVLYYSYIVYTRNICNTGGARLDAVYKSKFWSHLAAYFPIRFRYSQNFHLDPRENYLLNYHPHGISAFGCVTAFASNGLNFSELFPGINSRFMVHETSFKVPIISEIFTLRGDCSVNSKSIDFILSQRWKNPTRADELSGNLLAIISGGLAEADLSDAETLKIVVANRKGFVKKALAHGANLIPCVAFGENSVFTKVNFEPGSLFQRLEDRWYSAFGFKHPLYYGQSAVRGSKGPGFMPYKKPITVVMGNPIKVSRVENPSDDDINKLHSHYLQQLRQLYSDNSDLCTNYDTKLQIV